MITEFLHRFSKLCLEIDSGKIGQMVDYLKKARRVYVVGLGGSAGNASHMVNDLRKLCQIDAYCPTDNVSLFTALANDLGWEYSFITYLHTTGANAFDVLFVLSVGGGTQEVSQPITRAVIESKRMGMPVLGITGPNGGVTAAHGDCVIRVPESDLPTPFTEAMQAVIWHCLVSHPELQKVKTKW